MLARSRAGGWLVRWQPVAMRNAFGGDGDGGGGDGKSDGPGGGGDGDEGGRVAGVAEEMAGAAMGTEAEEMPEDENNIE